MNCKAIESAALTLPDGTRVVPYDVVEKAVGELESRIEEQVRKINADAQILRHVGLEIDAMTTAMTSLVKELKHEQ